MKILAWPAFKNAHLNPYNKLLYDAITNSDVSVSVEEYNPKRILEYLPKKYLKNRFDVFHCHWPFTWIVHKGSILEKWLKVFFFLITIDFLRFRGTKLVWTMHNIKPHEVKNPLLQKIFWHQYIRRLDGWISLSEGSARFAINKYQHLKNIPCFVIPHGHYLSVYPNVIGQEQARLKLRLEPFDKIAVFIGMIRPYKNAPLLIETFKKLDSQDWLLVIAGRVSDQGLEDEIVARSQDVDNIRLFLQFIEDDMIQVYLNAADITILPFQETLNSGSAILSLSFHRPVLVPDQGSMQDLQRLIGEDWVQTYSGKFTEQILGKALDWALTAPRGIKAPLEPLDWRVIGQQTLAAYQNTCSSNY